jgi:hypothetical protein
MKVRGEKQKSRKAKKREIEKLRKRGADLSRVAREAWRAQTVD